MYYNDFDCPQDLDGDRFDGNDAAFDQYIDDRIDAEDNGDFDGDRDDFDFPIGRDFDDDDREFRDSNDDDRDFGEDMRF